MKRRGFGAGTLSAVVLLCAAAHAEGATFCVSDPACLTGGGTSQATLQAAFDAADANGPALDRVEIGATTLPAGGTADSTNPVQLVGEGRDQTFVGGTGKIIKLDGAGSSTSDLTITLDSTSDTAGLESVGPATRVAVTATASSTTPTGIQIGPGDSSDLDVDFPSSSFSVGINMAALAGDPDFSLKDASVNAAIGVWVSAGSGSAAIRRVDIEARFFGVLLDNGTFTLDNSFIALGGNSSDIRALSASPTYGPVDLTARNLTLVGAGSGTGIQANAACTVPGSGTGPVTASVSSSIIRGFNLDLQRRGRGDCNPSVPSNLSVSYSIFDPAKVDDFSTGALTQGAGNLNVDPLFTNVLGGDFSLTPASPALDAGDPAGLVAEESLTDLAGNPRVADGNGDGTARRDMGAFEVPAADVPRTLTISYSKQKGRFKGVLGAALPDCRVDEVSVRRIRGRDDLFVGSDETNAKGKYSVAEKTKKGKYYATVEQSESASGASCLAAVSETLKLG
jgi:hypothetical protein